MMRCILLAAVVVSLAQVVLAEDKPAAAPTKLTDLELAAWIDHRFAQEYQPAGLKPAAAVDDATFLRRVYLDLQGRVPTVAQVRDFVAEQGSLKRPNCVERLLTSDSQPDRFARRSSEHLARVWRRVLVPAGSPNPGMAMQLEPWLSRQFADNVPFDQVARKLLEAAPPSMAAPGQPPPDSAAGPDAAAVAFQQAVGIAPENLTSAYARVFLGIRLNCAQCHDHPLADWKRTDFWGMAALLSRGDAQPGSLASAPTIKPATEDVTYQAKLLWAKAPLKDMPADKTPRELLADWMVSPDNPNFAATAVNRVWQYLCGQGLAGSVDDLDRVSPAERQVLDDLGRLFVAAGYDLRWLIGGICKSRVYQQAVAKQADEPQQDAFVHRPLKTLLPEQVFDSLEQALGLPVARADDSPRFNGERDQFVARMNESAPDTPTDYKGGIPQALMLMNGKLTADATSLETSRTLRAIVEAPFLKTDAKIETLYLATLTRKPRQEEALFLLQHVNGKSTDQDRKQAYAEILWGLLNSPEFVLSR